MSDLDPAVMDQFYMKDGVSANDVTRVRFVLYVSALSCHLCSYCWMQVHLLVTECAMLVLYGLQFMDAHPQYLYIFCEVSLRLSVLSSQMSGIRDLIPGSVIDATMFNPCGYSMNGMKTDVRRHLRLHVFFFCEKVALCSAA